MNRAAYLVVYPEQDRFGRRGVPRLGGYAPGFVEDWLEERLSRGHIVATPAGHLSFSEDFATVLESKFRSLDEP